MKVAVLGTGVVGQTLARAFVALGHEVRMGSREAGNPKSKEFVAAGGSKASEGTFADAVAFADVVVLATLGLANPEVIQAAGVQTFGEKVVIDTTNPLDFSKGFPPALTPAGTDSGGEIVQRLLPKAKVVKAFNTVGYGLMFKPDMPGGPPDMFIAGDDDEAKQLVSKLLADFGWGVVDLGGIQASRYLEAMCMAWVIHGGRTNTWTHAFKLLRK